MTHHLYNQKNEIYCEPIHGTYDPEMAVCSFDTDERARFYAKKVGLKSPRIRFLKGGQEMLVVAAINDLKEPSNGREYCFLPVHNETVLKSCLGCITSHGAA